MTASRARASGKRPRALGAPPPRQRRPRRRAPPAGSKRERTRQRLMERALRLFQERGVEATTMRDIAKAARLSLGAAYYHFPSKDDLVFAYYEDNQAEAEAAEASATGSVRERLGVILHAKLASIAPHKNMLAAIVQRLVNPADPVGAFSDRTRAIRERSIALFERALGPEGLSPRATALAARAAWLLQMALMLVFVHDDSPNEARTHGLVDDGLDLVVPMLPLLATPMGQAAIDRVSAALARAGIAPDRRHGLGPTSPGSRGDKLRTTTVV